jgi:hypothetical protein
MSGFFGFSSIKEWMDEADRYGKSTRKCVQCHFIWRSERFDIDSDICKSCQDPAPATLPPFKNCDVCRVKLPRKFFGGRRHDWYPESKKYTTCTFCEAKKEDSQWTKRQEETKQRLADEMREGEEAWWRRNGHKVAQWVHEYSLEGMAERLAEEGRRREAAQIRATPPWADPKKIAAIYEEAAKLTAETGIPHHVDHIVPLQGPVATYGPFKGMRIVFGLHWEGNLQVIPARDNVCKGNRWWPDMPEEQIARYMSSRAA